MKLAMAEAPEKVPYFSKIPPVLEVFLQPQRRHQGRHAAEAYFDKMSVANQNMLERSGFPCMALLALII